ncbi:thioester reductase domain-containing protein [Halioxenophilus aromaticivorans]|uniref:Thioester reductase (TE) domain-containing protein n=1 Tax=Halioxenophilus aromaticivorans TaxID=1306992 RepID=A0AAV3U5Z2_9ALTE
MSYQGKTSVNNIFMTGATGVMGARLLLEMLRTTDAMVYCLSRAKSAADAAERINALVDVYDTVQDSKDQRWRIVPVLGNLIEPQFGLAEDVYQELTESTDIVYHCAANVSLIASFKKLKPTNVDAVATMVEFCLCGQIPLIFVSSFSVIGDDLYHDVTMLETELDRGQNFPDLNYERSKFEAETLIHNASERGLNWAIVRPGNIWGDSQTGAYPLFETKVKGIYYEIIKTLVETGLTYTSEENFDISPVDYVSQATLFVGLNIHQTNHQTYHLTSRAPITYNQLVQGVRNKGYRIDEVPSEDYFSAIKDTRIMRDGKVYRSMFTDFAGMLMNEFEDLDLTEKGRWDTSAITGLLAGTFVQYPDFDQTIMNRYLDYCEQRGWINSVASQGPQAEILSQDDDDDEDYFIGQR